MVMLEKKVKVEEEKVETERELEVRRTSGRSARCRWSNHPLEVEKVMMVAG